LRIDYKCSTFDDFAEKIYEHIIGFGKKYDRIDVICDRYFEESFKSDTRNSRGCGSELSFDGQTAFPADFKGNFLRNSRNKENLHIFLAVKLMGFHKNVKSFTVTKGDTILSITTI